MAIAPLVDKQNQPVQLSFYASLKVDLQGSRIISDGGLILVRELGERLDFGELIAQHLNDPRRGKNTQLPLADLFRQSVYSRIAGESPHRVVLDMDGTLIPVDGQQEQSAYNGHFESTCYHPLLVFNRESDCLAAKLRPGNVHSADDWEELLLPEIERQRKQGKDVVLRADAAFAKPEIYEALEERGVKYAIRIPSNDSLERDINGLLTRPVGRPGYKPVAWHKGFLYQAASWTKARRVVAKVESHFGELFPRVGFIVTNLETDSLAVVRFYNKRGTAEQWIKGGKQAVKMTRLSCHRFRSNEVRLWLSLIAYNLGNLWRRLFASMVRRIAVLPAPTE